MSMNHIVQGGKSDISIEVKDIQCQEITLQGQGSVHAFDQQLNTTDNVLFNQLRLNSTMFTDPNQAVNKEYVDQSYPGLASLQIAYTGGNVINTEVGFPLELKGSEGVSVEKTNFNDQDLVTKKYVQDNLPQTTLQDAYDNGKIITTSVNNPVDILGTGGLSSSVVNTTQLASNSSLTIGATNQIQILSQNLLLTTPSVTISGQVSTQQTTFNDDQNLVTKKFVQDSITDIPIPTLQDTYDAGSGQIALTTSKPLEITGTEGVNVNANSITTTKLTFNNSQEFVTKQYVDDKDGIKVVQRFNVLTTTVLYEDNFVKFSWIPGDNQPSYEIKTLPQGQGAFASYVDVNIIFTGGANLIGTNDDGLSVVNTKGFFTGNVLDTAYTHLNYGSKSTCSLSSESDIDYPYYTLEVMTGSMQYTGIAVTQRF